MPALAQYAAELDALVRDGRRIRLGDRNFEKPHADLDELLGRLSGLADRMRAGAFIPPAANDGGPGGSVPMPPIMPVTGRGQILHVVARRH